VLLETRFGLEPWFRRPPTQSTVEELLNERVYVVNNRLPGQQPCRACAAVLLNVAHWPASSTAANRLLGSTDPGPRPWSHNRTTSHVTRLIEWLGLLHNATGVPVGWVAATALPINNGGKWIGPDKKATACPPTDLRWPHVLARYNEAAREAAGRFNVGFVDVFTPTLDLLDLSFDAAHYGPPVSSAIARTVEEWLEQALAQCRR
jgi:hypothetical protein